jgi:hypothetical protein
MNSSQQQFLNKGRGPQLKIQTQKRIRYLLHYFGKNFTHGHQAIAIVSFGGLRLVECLQLKMEQFTWGPDG